MQTEGSIDDINALEGDEVVSRVIVRVLRKSGRFSDRGPNKKVLTA
jgi:hypothetical protein